MTPILKMDLPIRTESTLNKREPWHALHRRKKAQLAALALALRPLGVPRLPVVVTLTRIGPRLLDGDNLQGALKTVRDGIATWLGHDDAHPEIDWRYRQEIGSTTMLRLFTRSGRMTRAAEMKIRVEIAQP
jgi:hypothetical protein